MQGKIDAAHKDKEFMQLCFEEVRFHLYGITETSRRDRDFKQMISQIKAVEEIIADTERERKKQQDAIFGVMNMINTAGGLIPKVSDIGTQTDASIPSRYADIFTEVPLDKLWNESSSLIHKMATLRFELPSEEPSNSKKLKKKEKTAVEPAAFTVTADESFRFFSKIFIEK